MLLWLYGEPQEEEFRYTALVLPPHAASLSSGSEEKWEIPGI